MTHDPRTRWPDGDADDERALALLRSATSGIGVCPPPEVVQAAKAGILPPQAQERIDMHVAHCSICQTLVTSLEDESLGELAAEEAARIRQRVESTIAHVVRTERRTTWRWAAAAGVFALGAGATVMLWPTNRERADAPASAPRELRAPAGVPPLLQSESTMRLSGVVTGPNGEPLAGVTVGEHVGSFGGQTSEYLVMYSTRFKATTDASGRYTVTGVPVSRGRRTVIRAAKLGYFTESTDVEVAREMQADFRLSSWVHIRLGDTVTGTVTPGDKASPDQFERFDEFALTVAGNGTLEVSVDAQNRDRMDLYLETPTGEFYGPRMGAPMRLALPAMSGATYQIRVLSSTTEPRPYTLTTRLK
jgi:hypothetical protein